MHAKDPVSGPLAGIKVVDLTRGLPGAIATMLLADYGADVLKLQNPSGNLLESSAAFRVWNRSKKSVALDLSQPEDLRASLELARDADVFLESFRPGVAERWGAAIQRLKMPTLASSIAPYPPLVAVAHGRIGTVMKVSCQLPPEL